MSKQLERVEIQTN